MSEVLLELFNKPNFSAVWQQGSRATLVKGVWYFCSRLNHAKLIELCTLLHTCNPSPRPVLPSLEGARDEVMLEASVDELRARNRLQ